MKILCHMSRMDSVNLGKKDHSLEIKFDMIFDQQFFFCQKKSDVMVHIGQKYSFSPSLHSTLNLLRNKPIYAYYLIGSR